MATLKLVFGVAVFAALVFAGIKIIPPFFSNYELEDSIKTEALQATYTTRTEEDIRAAIIKQARNYDIAVDAQAGASYSGGRVRHRRSQHRSRLQRCHRIARVLDNHRFPSFVEKQRRVLGAGLQVLGLRFQLAPPMSF